MEEENKTYIQKKIEMELSSLEPPKPLSLKQSIWFVVAAHILIGGLIYGYSNKSHAKEDKKFLETKDAEYAGIPEPTPSPTPSPQATPVVVTNVEIPKTNDWPKPKSIPSVYYVNSGDTLYSISKRYQVPIKTILKKNNLKDNSKIKLGQKIKLK